jgi:hypothetical protein
MSLKIARCKGLLIGRWDSGVGRAGAGAGVPGGHWRNYPPLPQSGGQGEGTPLGPGDAG